MATKVSKTSVLAPPVRHARDMHLAIPDEGDEKLFALFLDNANVPHIEIAAAKGRRVWPLEHELIRSYVTHYLFDVSGNVLPTKGEIDGFLSVLKAKAVINGQRMDSTDWQDNVLEQDALTNAIYTLTLRRAPKPWEATAAEILTDADVLAAKTFLDKGPDWPKAPNRLSIELEKRQELFKQLGVSVTRLARVGVARKWRLEMIRHDGGDGAVSEPSQPASPGSSHHNSLADNGLDQGTQPDDDMARDLERIVGESGPVKELSPDDIRKWIPSRWEQFVANELALDELQLFVGDVLDGTRADNILLIGAKNTGKDAMLQLMVNSLLCDEPDGQRNPCGVCTNCLWQVGGEREFGNVSKGDELQFMRLDCANCGPDTLAYEASKVAGFKGRLIVYLAGLDGLKKDRLPDLLELMADKRFLWLATASQAGAVVQELLKCFQVITTENPTEKDLARFLAGRCQAWGIKVDSGHTLTRLAHVCDQITGDALAVLAGAAATVNRQLTLAAVEESLAQTA